MKTSLPDSRSLLPLGSLARTGTVRWRILGLLFAISVITYVDRVNISVAARQMMPALGLTDQQMGYVFSAFVAGYALCQIPGGWLGDRWGARRVLTAAIVWWSFCTAATATAATGSLAALVGVVGALATTRFFLGVGESLALPNMNRAVADWLPPREQSLGIGLAISGVGLGAAITPPLTAWIMVNFGWQTAFYVAAAAGLMVAAVWHWYATDGPRTHPGIQDFELAHIESGKETNSGPLRTPWRRFVATKTVWWLLASYACLGYVAYVYMSWFYLYLVNVRGFGDLRGAWFAAAPFLAMLVGCPLGGWLTDRLTQSLGVSAARQRVGMGGMIASGVAIAAGAWAPQPSLAVLLLSLGAGSLYFTAGAYWSSTVHLSKSHAGTLSGLMNTSGNITGSLSPTLTPWLAERFGWEGALIVAAGVAVIGGIMWRRIDPGAGLAKEPWTLRKAAELQ
ncbi:MFS transporter [Nitrospira sp.]|nr:MFS transporter [Nitrospira sp.]